MPICSYLVIPELGAADGLTARLNALPGCDALRAENRDVILLVTETSSPGADRELRDTVERWEEVRALVLTFGEVDPETPEANRVAERGSRRRSLPVIRPPGTRSGRPTTGPSTDGSPR